MCDCYYQKCGTKNCRRKISVHIAGSCMDQKFLTVFCEHCSKKILEGKHQVRINLRDPLVIIDKITNKRQVLGEDSLDKDQKGIGKVGEKVILIIDPEANLTKEEIRGIHLN